MRPPWLALALGCAGAAAALLGAGPVTLAPRTFFWEHFAKGGSGGARLMEPVVVWLPGLPARTTLAIDAEPLRPGGTRVAISLDGDASSSLEVTPGMPRLPLAPREPPGGALTLTPSDPIRLRALRLWLPVHRVRAIAMGAAMAVLALVLFRGRPRAEAVAWCVLAVCAIALVSTPALAWLTLGSLPSLARVVPSLAIAAAAAAALLRDGTRRRRRATAMALVSAAWVGFAARLLFLPSAGSWDVDYWRTAVLRADREGLTQVYGGPEVVPPGHLRAQLRGVERVSADTSLGRPIPINYPPGAIALWLWCWRLVRPLGGSLDAVEAQSLAVKLPSLAGDLVAVALLVFIHRDRPWRGAVLGALYWALPVSWLSAAVQGYQDGAYAPLVLIALLLAARGRAVGSGIALAAALLIKLPALVAAPAAVGALVARGTSWKAAVAACAAFGAAFTVPVLLALAPFAAAGTSAAALAHINSIWLPGPLSAGCPNVWWLVGHAHEVAQGASPQSQVAYVKAGALVAAGYLTGRLLCALAALVILWHHRRFPGDGPAVLAAAALFYAYGMFATGVFENHLHPMYLLLLATGLAIPRLRWIAAATASIYVVNMLLLSGLGRLWYPRQLLVEPLSEWIARLRMALGFDLTLALAALHVGLFAAFAWTFRPSMRALARAPADTKAPVQAA